MILRENRHPGWASAVDVTTPVGPPTGSGNRPLRKYGQIFAVQLRLRSPPVGSPLRPRAHGRGCVRHSAHQGLGGDVRLRRIRGWKYFNRLWDDKDRFLGMITKAWRDRHERQSHKCAVERVSGRMGTNQHLARSILAIREQGGVRRAMELPRARACLDGRTNANCRPRQDLWGFELHQRPRRALADPANVIFFDSQKTALRTAGIKKAFKAGKPFYCKAHGHDGGQISCLYPRKAAGIKNGVVQDKLWLPGLLKLKSLIDTGVFGRYSPCGAISATGFRRLRSALQRPS